MFLNYPEIENLYKRKKIDKFLKFNPNARHNQYIAQTKYDGTNIQFCFEPNQEMRIAKRSQLLGRDENFYGILDVLDRYQDILNYVQIICDDIEKPINLFGELFGQGIQKRINYGPDKYLKFFDIAVNGEFFTYSLAKIRFPKLVDNHYVETFGPYRFSDIEHNIKIPEGHEGIVIKPFNMVDQNEIPLILKSKSSDFEEKAKSKKNKQPKEEDPVETELFNKLMEYINHNRLKSIFSKEGEIEEDNQIGNYIKLVMEDVKKDFEEDVDLNDISRNQLGNVYKMGNREIVKLLKEYL